MAHHRLSVEELLLSRRELLSRCGTGLGSLALAGLMADANLLTPAEAASPQALGPLVPRQPHFAPKARRVIHIFANGGPSHVDTFDPKPALEKYAGKPLPASFKTERKTGSALPSPFKFQKYGKSGLEISDLFAKTAQHADDLCVIRSMFAEVPNHEPSLMLMNCGDQQMVRPSMGSWVTYGLGTENQNLPGFIVLCPGGLPVKESENWRAAFLPGVYQGTHIDTQHTDIQKLIEFIRNGSQSLPAQRRQLDLLRQINEDHKQSHRLQGAADPQLEARIQSFELAFRMQTEAADAFDVDKEPQHVRESYGTGTHARQLLVARRLLERGVRFVQVWHGAGQPWDNHDDIQHHQKLAEQTDQPIAALLADLKQRGMLEDTLVIWSGEFGRTPAAENGKGRDHNHYGFSLWLAGGGVKGGHIHGSTDEFGWAAQQDRMPVHDLHATILHLLGFNHEKLTYRYAGRDFRLTDVHGNVVKAILK
jgi:hypothetical protein